MGTVRKGFQIKSHNYWAIQSRLDCEPLEGLKQPGIRQPPQHSAQHLAHNQQISLNGCTTSWKTSNFFAKNSASGRTTLGGRTEETRLSGTWKGQRFRVRVRVLALRPPTVTHPDALHHGDVLILVRLESDPAGAGRPAHGFCFCPRRHLARTHKHHRPHAHTSAWTRPNSSPAQREQGHDPSKQGEAAGRELPPPPVTRHNKNASDWSTIQTARLSSGEALGMVGADPDAVATGGSWQGSRSPLGILGIVVLIWYDRCRDFFVLTPWVPEEHRLLGVVILTAETASNWATFTEVHSSDKARFEDSILEV